MKKKLLTILVVMLVVLLLAASVFTVAVAAEEAPSSGVVDSGAVIPAEPAEETGTLTGFVKDHVTEILAVLSACIGIATFLFIKCGFGRLLKKVFALLTQKIEGKATEQNLIDSQILERLEKMSKACEDMTAAREMYIEAKTQLEQAYNGILANADLTKATADIIHTAIMSGEYPDYIRNDIAEAYKVVCNAYSVTHGENHAPKGE